MKVDPIHSADTLNVICMQNFKWAELGNGLSDLLDLTSGSQL